jgi:hypothetical protein
MPGKLNDHNFHFFFEKNQNCLEWLDMVRKLIEQKFHTNLPPPPQKKGLKNKKKVLRIA